MNANEYTASRLAIRELPLAARGFVKMLSRLQVGSLTLVDPQGRSELFGQQGAQPACPAACEGLAHSRLDRSKRRRWICRRLSPRLG